MLAYHQGAGEKDEGVEDEDIERDVRDYTPHLCTSSVFHTHVLCIKSSHETSSHSRFSNREDILSLSSRVR